MKLNWHRLTRKSHRYLGVFIGLQFLAWTLGGLYFSWTGLDAVHRSDLIGPAPELSEAFQPVPVGIALQHLEAAGQNGFDRIDLIPYSTGAAVYRIQYKSSEGPEVLLVEAATGEIRGGLTLEESQALANSRYAGSGKLLSVRTLEATGPHDEYRELPLPAYAFTFGDDRKTTLYIAPNHARLTSVRNGKWRVFDFLWMLHTMDYESRDNFNNLLLRSFSILGLLTILSGFLLFFLSSPLLRRRSAK